MPVWVTFPNLDISFWSINGLSKVASTIGQPLFADICTTFKERIAYARMLIEVDVSTKLPELTSMQDPFGNLLAQQVYNEWVPYFCTKCKRLGHEYTGCTATNVKALCVPKGTQLSNPVLATQINITGSNEAQQEHTEQDSHVPNVQQVADEQ